MDKYNGNYKNITQDTTKCNKVVSMDSHHQTILIIRK